MSTATELEPIEKDQALPLDTFKRKAGLSDWALRTARRNGLKVRKCGKRRYVLGRDWIEYLEKQG